MKRGSGLSDGWKAIIVVIGVIAVIAFAISLNGFLRDSVSFSHRMEMETGEGKVFNPQSEEINIIPDLLCPDVKYPSSVTFPGGTLVYIKIDANSDNDGPQQPIVVCSNTPFLPIECNQPDVTCSTVNVNSCTALIACGSIVGNWGTTSCYSIQACSSCFDDQNDYFKYKWSSGGCVVSKYKKCLCLHPGF